MRITKNTVVRTSDITRISVHNLVIECFKAAGFDNTTSYRSYRSDSVYGVASLGVKDIDLHKPLTIEELVNCENSITWPEGYNMIGYVRGNDRLVFYVDGKYKYYGRAEEYAMGDGFNLELKDIAPIATKHSKVAPPATYTPQVNEACEYSLGDSNAWYACTVVSLAPNLVLDCPHVGKLNLEFNDYNFTLQVWYGDTSREVTFRPLKPKTERELFVEATAKIIKNADDNVISAELLYDAGYRLPEGGAK